MVMLGGYLNVHVGQDIEGFESRNELEMLHEFTLAHNLTVMNICFEKKSRRIYIRVGREVQLWLVKFW